MAKEKSCGAVVFKKQREGNIRYLLLHYDAGHWDFPKGNQEKKETEEQTAVREIKEETGIEDIEFVDDFKETIKYFYKKGEETVYKEVAYYLEGFGDIGIVFCCSNKLQCLAGFNCSNSIFSKTTIKPCFGQEILQHL